MDLPDGIEQLNIQDGIINIRIFPGLLSDDFALRVGSTDLPLQPAADADVAFFYMPFPLDPNTLVKGLIPPEVVSGGILNSLRGWRRSLFGRGVYFAGINTLKDWALSNGKTVQLQIFRPTPAAELALGCRVDVPAHDKPYEFRALLAVHRGEADLHLNIETVQGDAPQQITLPFDTGKLGGKNPEGYQPVSIDLAPTARDTTLSLSVSYKGYRPGPEDNDCFIFIANPEIVSKGNAKAPISSWYVFNKTVPGAVWYQAKIPEQGVSWGTPLSLTLVAGTQEVTVIQAQETKLSLVEDYGHSLVMRASRPDRYAFFLNGTLAFAAQINPDDTNVRIPPDYLTGDTYHLTVRNPAGTQVLLETYLLLPRILTPEDVLQRESKAPFPGALASQAAHRYAALKAQIAHKATPKTLAQISHAVQVLEGGYGNVKLKPLSFPKVTKPDVSIIIPAYNKIEVTYSALCALLLAHNEASFEVIVVDDASTDATATLEKLVSGISVIHNTESQRFIRACNAGAASARGDYIVLLNNDTEPTTGWLDALIDAFARFPNVGLVGSKLLYPNGRLQDAGGIIWGSGNPWNYGNNQNPWDPRYTYARQADYLSGAALMTSAEIWDEVGGLSEYLKPMYFEDTDLAFKVRDAGYTTWFVPASVVYHYEGMTSGTDVSAGFKKYQEVNRPKFKRRWAKAYAGFGSEGLAPDLEKDRGIVGRVLFIDYTTPRPDRDAGSYAAIKEIKLVQSLGYKVTFLPQNLAHFGTYTEALERDGVEVITAPFYLSIQEFLEKRCAEFDVVYITRYYVGEATIDHIRRVAPEAKIILNNADLHFLRQLRTGLAQNDPDQIAEARLVRDAELAVLHKADVVLSYNEVEHSVIQSHTDGVVKVLTCPWVVDIPDASPGLEGRAGLSFLGSFKHHPNEEGVIWFADHVMSHLGKTHPGTVLSIYGSGMSDPVRALASENIDAVGFVPEIADAYDRHRVFVAPLLSGAGIKGKVLSALAHGIPTVMSPVAAEGIGLRHGHDCMIANTPAEWQDAILRLCDDDALWTRLSTNARNYVKDNFSFATGRRKMRAAFEAVQLFSPRD